MWQVDVVRSAMAGVSAFLLRTEICSLFRRGRILGVFRARLVQVPIPPSAHSLILSLPLLTL